ncbi:hypothetical protein DICVIV_13529 [Dictyocaulus viviparus]|uniref:Uncharacterized protein n=1 Tax=Dictyocaulus viviparus TaxID=29172 RepID=A0A0D8XDJ7_DICVI|nr:hypothetical protein DICVIV_13529 [Dictyocaulus viviparus]
MEIRDTLCDLGRMEIPRPQFYGMQFVATRGKQGFYKTIRDNGSKYGIQVKAQRSRRPVLSNDLFLRPLNMEEKIAEDRHSTSRTKPNNTDLNQYTQHVNNSDSRNKSICMELEPDYPDDYIPPHTYSNKNSKSHKTSIF